MHIHVNVCIVVLSPTLSLVVLVEMLIDML
jgi:hypothetical protein